MKRDRIKKSIILATLGLGIIAQVHGELVLQEYFDYGSTKVELGYGSWQDSTTRFWYEGTRNLNFANASYGSGPNTGTGCAETDNAYNGMRGAQLTFSSTGLTGEIWMSALVRVRGGALFKEGVVLSVHDAAYSNGGAALSHFGLGDPIGGTPLAPMFMSTPSSATPVFGSDTGFVEGTTDSAVYLLVAKLNVSASTDSVSLWMLKSSDTFGWTEASLGTPDLAESADFGASAKNLWIGMNAATCNIDAIRISDADGDAGLREVLTGLPAPSGGTVILLM